MKADPAAQGELLGLQRIDSRLAAIERKLTASPLLAKIRDAQAQLTDVAAQVREATGTLDDIQAELGRAESDIQVVADRIVRDRTLLDASSNTKEAQSLQNELDSLAKRQAALEEVQLEVMQREEDQLAVVAQLSESRHALEAELTQLRAQNGTEAGELESERHELASERGPVAAGIDPALLALYERVRSRGLGLGAARLEGRVCGSCAIQLGPADFATISQLPAGDVAQCPQCDAILVREVQQPA